MIFGPTQLAEAEGAVLAHTTRVPGRVLKKGLRLDTGALAALRSAGIAEVIAARLEPGDVDEDTAARRLADALGAPGLAPTRAATGRVNLLARDAGFLRVDAACIDAVNGVAESLTVATLPDAVPVVAGDMVATVKIIPFAVPGNLLGRAERAAAARPALRLHPWRGLATGLVLTTLPHVKASVLDGTVAATRGRIEALGGVLLPPVRCAHERDAVADALAGLLDRGAELLLVAGASAVVDRADVGPAGIVRAGGAIEHFGMPVDPGNLICLGRIGDVPALVLPGCARSPKPNGIDRVLHRLFAGLGCTGADIAAMGVGGLLKEFSARPLRRGRASRPPPDVAAIVLAAGRSSRMAPHHKLLLPDRDGTPMIARVVDHVLGSAARPVLVVTGHREDEVRAALSGRAVRFVTASGYADGLSASLRAGLEALPEASPAALVVLGDMPFVTADMLNRMIAAYDPDEGRSIVAAAHGGEIGNPVLWDRRYFADMLALTGDRGARALLGRYPEAVAEIELGEAVLRDFDTPESLADLVA
jgi:molybdenum cofactor cytidylyltransferase